MASGVGGGRKQRRMGPAPFASFEDLSDEVRPGTESPGENATSSTRLPGINEDSTPAPTPTSRTSTLCLSVVRTTTVDGGLTLTPSTPRIDISRASSSSHHEDSRDSTPERELFQAQAGQPCTRLGLAFKEDGALDLRSSTEELDFHEPCESRRSPITTTSVTVAVTSDLPLQHQRKDSQSSDFGGLLSISGRTSRLSSIGSQGSRVSNASHLSVMSGTSRSPSPHKMLLETSFCGSKSENSQSTTGAANDNTAKIIEDELLERVLLSRKHDPTEAILAEGISIECRRKIQPADQLVKLSPVLQHEHTQSHGALNIQPVQQVHILPTQQLQSIKTHPDDHSTEQVITKEQDITKIACVPIDTVSQIISQVEVQIQATPASALAQIPLATPPEKPARKIPPPPKRSPKAEVIITVNKPTEDIINTTQDMPTTTIAVIDPDLVPGKTIVADSGVEYTFIPLKGPFPKKATNKVKILSISSPKSASAKSTNHPVIDSISPSASIDYIRIKLKPDHMYKNEATNTVKPATLDLSNGGATKPAVHVPSSPKQLYSNTPSPTASRKSSFASLFRAKEYGTSPESPTVPASVRKKTPRSRSKSSDRERAVDASDKNNPSKHRSVFTLFKTKKSCHKSKQSLTETSPKPATSLHSLEFTFDRPPVKKYYEVPLDGDSIIIPLHSPTSPSHNEPTTNTLRSKKMSVIEQREQKVVVTNDDGVGADASHRQSSTSSENIVFTTNLGSDNEIFTTKLPKRNDRITETVVTPECTEEKKANTKQSVLVSNSSVSKTLPQPSPPPQFSQPTPLVANGYKRKSLPKVELEQQVTVITQHVEQMLLSTNNNSVVDDEVDTSERAAFDGNDSSESENENLLKVFTKRNITATTVDDDESNSEHERKGLVLQQDSFEDDLPYVPTTLPLERSMAIPIVPVKQRATYEIRTCPIERPRSTTPINPSCLEDYCEDSMNAVTAEKLRISLPRDDSLSTNNMSSAARAKSPRRWTEFIPQQQQETTAPPLPPRGAPKDWINFEDIPERRKPPKRIQTIPSSRSVLQPTAMASSTTTMEDVIYSYVNPEDCKCECHETTTTRTGTTTVHRDNEDDELPLLLTSEKRNDSSPESLPGGRLPPPPPIKRIPTCNTVTTTESANAFPHVSKTS